MSKPKWELYVEPSTWRLKIPGGYLYRHGFTNVCMAFAPDEKSAGNISGDINEPPESWTGYCEKE